MDDPENSFSETLLRQPGTGGRALAGLELRVRFADHINRALALDDLAISVAALGGGEGREDFHDGNGVSCGRSRVPTGGAKASQPTRLVKPFLGIKREKSTAAASKQYAK